MKSTSLFRAVPVVIALGPSLAAHAQLNAVFGPNWYPFAVTGDLHSAQYNGTPGSEVTRKVLFEADGSMVVVADLQFSISAIPQYQYGDLYLAHIPADGGQSGVAPPHRVYDFPGGNLTETDELGQVQYSTDGIDRIRDAVLDSAGNVYVVGVSGQNHTSQGGNFVVAKFTIAQIENGALNPSWVYTGPAGEGFAIKYANDRLYATGSVGASPNRDVYTVVLPTTGPVNGLPTYSATFNNGRDDRGQYLDVIGNNLYITGPSDGSTSWPFTLRYTDNGAGLLTGATWHGDVGVGGPANVTGISASANNTDVYIVGHTSGGAPPEEYTQVSHINAATGAVAWSVTIADEQNPGAYLAFPNNIPIGIAADSIGRVWVGAKIYREYLGSHAYDLRIARWTAAGANDFNSYYDFGGNFDEMAGATALDPRESPTRTFYVSSMTPSANICQIGYARESAGATALTYPNVQYVPAAGTSFEGAATMSVRQTSQVNYPYRLVQARAAGVSTDPFDVRTYRWHRFELVCYGLN